MIISRGENPPRGAAVHFYLKQASADTVSVRIEDPLSGRAYAAQVEGKAGINRIRWQMAFAPSADEKEVHRAMLQGVLDETVRVVSDSAGEEDLGQMRKDLLAIQRYPNLYDDAEYPERDDARRLLLDHLAQINQKLAEATATREFYGVREQLLAFSQVMGDRAFFGFYGEELRDIEAPAGDYRVVITVDGQAYTGSVTIREDPLLDDGAP